MSLFLGSRKIRRIWLMAIFVSIIIYAGLPRFMSVSSGLPYHHFWDEPSSATGALVSMKTNNFFPHGQDLVYGGAIRYPLMLVDYIYYQYLRLSPHYDVDRKSDIKTHLEGVYKTTSHSGFYYWSRTFVVAINLLAFLFVFEIGRLRMGYATGLIAVILLASIAIYYERSFLVNVDLPLSTWLLGVIYFSLRFDRYKNKRDFYLSLICVGLAGATKYTGALTFIIPVAAAIMNRNEFKWVSRSDVAKSILKWGGICFAVFALLNPTTIRFPDRMFKTILWIGMVYRTGQGHFSKEPGLEHLSYQISQLVLHYGQTFMLLACAGLLIGTIQLTRRRFWTSGANSGFLLVVLFPIVYLFYVTFIYTIAYHRNFSLMYPILALLSAQAVTWIIHQLTNLSAGISRYRKVVEATAVVFFLYLSWPGYSGIMHTARITYHGEETRTQSILAVNEIINQGNQVFLGICDDLLMSPEDLRMLKADYGFFKITDLDSAMVGFTHLMIPDLRANHQVRNFDSLKAVIDKHIATRELTRIPGNKLEVQSQLSDLEFPVYNPTVILLNGENYPPPRMNHFTRSLERREAATVDSNNPVEIISGWLSPGKYYLLFDARGDGALGEYPVAQVVIGTDTLDTIYLTQDFLPYRVGFTVSDKSRINVLMMMTNDLYDEERGLDRNVHLRRLEIYPQKKFD